jgi:hypothetical protein
LVDTPTRFQDRREEAARAQLRDLQLEITGLRRQCAWPVPDAFGHPVIGALVTGGADHLGGLDLDQLLGQEPAELAHQNDTAFAVGEHDKKFGHRRLRQSHRSVLLCGF